MNRQRLVRIVFVVLIATMLAAIFVRGVSWLIQGRIDYITRTGGHFVRDGPEARWAGGLIALMALLPVTLALKGRYRVLSTIVGIAAMVSLSAFVILEFSR